MVFFQIANFATFLLSWRKIKYGRNKKNHFIVALAGGKCEALFARYFEDKISRHAPWNCFNTLHVVTSLVPVRYSLAAFFEISDYGGNT